MSQVELKKFISNADLPTKEKDHLLTFLERDNTSYPGDGMGFEHLFNLAKRLGLPEETRTALNIIICRGCSPSNPNMYRDINQLAGVLEYYHRLKNYR